MSKTRKRSRAQCQEAASDLADYFASDGRTAGLKSGLGAMSSEGSSGVRRDAHDRMADAIDAGRIEMQRRVRAALLAVGAEGYTVLWRLYAAHDSSADTFVVARGKEEEHGRLPDAAMLKQKLGNLLPLALDTRALAAETDTWFRADLERYKAAVDEAATAEAEDVAERAWALLGARAVMRARVAAGPVACWPEATEPDVSSPAARDRYRMLLRICQASKYHAALDRILDEAADVAERWLVAFAERGGYPVRHEAHEDGSQKERAKPMRCPRIPSHMREIAEALEARS